MPTIMLVYGTRPEAIKMAPIVDAVKAADDLTASVVVTGQHREMLDQVNGLFGITPDFDLELLAHGQTLAQMTTKVLDRLTPVLEEVRPDAVVVQGDTTSAFAAGLAAFYQKIPVFHVEAGLRTEDPLNPFPEEMNRRLATRLSVLHLAPTSTSRDNLLVENVDPASVVVTGNSVIDALLSTVRSRDAFETPALQVLDSSDGKMVLVTAHRRESWGAPLESVGRALARLATTFTDVTFVLPLHANPVVRESLVPAVGDLSNVIITDPLAYGDFSRLIERATVVLTDSGGVQEEAPSLGKPVLVMRENTERPEAVEAGTVRLVGTDEDAVVEAVTSLLTDEAAFAAMANAVNPYGDGRAAERTVAAIRQYFGLGERIADFPG
ncbi:UDP-N-Acetylglucosamine 2-epimerase [Sanguibacter keddieii DSM 10542]|uniref:UDP-N-acetylglucosamine 2-epimerase (non-hydrolyzing) n=1 Tax=Sanguibacter keddieii (strain ATCC 51767 / DSM 10542 / NCFB 3025 / ST-74) TaxID=446469 RepID=D1BC50_SANKS|nr:UDP-N-acetylglucosamine 2-epimerase (non-hydrolyzing) [Sanguibacter keddieii]ACZ20830.1 UDP-N-Acetylglucosamine 2-epimerase [Sanguibacter keddieii DSM 10542]